MFERGASIASLAAIAATTLTAPPATAQSGDALFKQRCAICHTTIRGSKAGIGPNLAGVVGRPAASTSFTYSPALTKSRLKWDRATLDKFLTAPGKLVPGTRMVNALPDDKQRAAVISYLATLKN